MTEEKLVEKLKEKGLTVSTAESCTGGMVAMMITSVSGASEVFKYGAVTYANETKQKVLSVSGDTLGALGAVSAETALQMAQGVRKTMGADIGVSVTGVAGPSMSEGKPVGLVYIGVSSDRMSHVSENRFSGNREEIRRQAAEKALCLALEAADEA